eukprot:1010522-Ditylum_brightwellii.AAC.1
MPLPDLEIGSQQSDDYKNKKNNNGVPWLINNLRKITSGIYNESDEVDSYIQVLWEWTHLCQSKSNIEGKYQKRADTAMQNIILVGGRDVLCSRQLLPPTTTDKDKPDGKSKK